jgi:hypothetical membrane protein
MRIENRSLSGALIFVGAAQHLLVIAIAEALHPGYTVATNYLSDLGVGQTALMYNASAVVFGGFVLIGSLVGRRTLGPGLTITLAVTGACAVGAGLFPETTGAPHSIFALVMLSFGAVSAILSYRVLRPPLSYVSVGLGIFALVADVLFFSHHDLGIGPGGMERMIAYPIYVWALGFGGALIGAK